MSRVVLFASGGPVAHCALDALAAAHQVLVVRPAARREGGIDALRSAAATVARGLGLLDDDALSRRAMELATPLLAARAGEDARVAAEVAAFRADVGCIATFPRRISEELIAASGTVVVNVHSSLLPRHRGADPLFWTYHAGDREAGATVHVATARFDAGPVLLREVVPIERGAPVTEVHARCASAGAHLLAAAVRLIVEGRATYEPQDEALATRAPRVRPGRVMSDLAAWDAEHAWHFLAGLVARYREPFADTDGQAVHYDRVEGFEVGAPRARPGSVEKTAAGWTAWARDGAVFLASGRAGGGAA